MNSKSPQLPHNDPLCWERDTRAAGLSQWRADCAAGWAGPPGTRGSKYECGELGPKLSVCRCPTAGHGTRRRTQAEAGRPASAPPSPRTVSGPSTFPQIVPPSKQHPPSLPAHPATGFLLLPPWGRAREGARRGRTYQTPAGALGGDVTGDSTGETLGGERTRPQRGWWGQLLPARSCFGGWRAGAGTDRRGAALQGCGGAGGAPPGLLRWPSRAAWPPAAVCEPVDAEMSSGTALCWHPPCSAPTGSTALLRPHPPHRPVTSRRLCDPALR